jgi:ATP-dependent DNA helicase RecG
LIIKSIKQHGSLNRNDIDELLWKKLPDWMDDSQKANKVGNLISELRIKGKIRNIGVPKKPKWVILQKNN